MLPDAAPLDARPRLADFGRVGDWRPLCEAAAAIPPGDDAASRRFFETAFVPLAVADYRDAEGLFTGYYEIELNGSRRREGRYQTPIYRRPPELGSGARYSRAEIEDGALAGRGLELFWVDDPIDAFFLEIQGSGRVRLRNGATVRVGYDGQNGQPYVPIGRLLVERGAIPREQLTMITIRNWMKQYPAGRGCTSSRESILCVLPRGAGRRPDRRRKGRADPGAEPRGRPGLYCPRRPDLGRSRRAFRIGRGRAAARRGAGHRGRHQRPGARRSLLGNRERGGLPRRRDERPRPLLPAAAAQRRRPAYPRRGNGDRDARARTRRRASPSAKRVGLPNGRPRLFLQDKNRLEFPSHAPVPNGPPLFLLFLQEINSDGPLLRRRNPRFPMAWRRKEQRDNGSCRAVRLVVNKSAKMPRCMVARTAGIHKTGRRNSQVL